MARFDLPGPTAGPSNPSEPTGVAMTATDGYVVGTTKVVDHGSGIAAGTS